MSRFTTDRIAHCGASNGAVRATDASGLDARAAGPATRADATRSGGLVRTAVIAFAAAAIGGCTLIPGTSGSLMREESSVPLPVTEGTDTVPANVKLKPITAELIIEQHQAKESRFRSGKAGGQTATRASDPKKIPGFDYQDYKLGPGDIINVIVWDHPEITIPAGSYRSAEQSGTLVAEDGTIFFPFAGVVKVAGLTPARCARSSPSAWPASSKTSSSTCASSPSAASACMSSARSPSPASSRSTTSA